MTVTDNAVSVDLLPFRIPFSGKRVQRAEIEQFYVQQISNSTSTESMASYEVWILTRDGRRIPFLDVGKATGKAWGPQTKIDAEYIEMAIEERLAIIDTHVKGEHIYRFHGGGGDPAGHP